MTPTRVQLKVPLIECKFLKINLGLQDRKINAFKVGQM